MQRLLARYSFSRYLQWIKLLIIHRQYCKSLPVRPKIVTAKCIFGVFMLFVGATANAQVKTNLLGLRAGCVKNTYYDESMNFKIYNGFVFNPYHIRFVRNRDRNTYIADLLYISNVLSPVNKDNLTASDVVNYRSGTIEFEYLRQLNGENMKLDFRIGSKLSANGYESLRFYKKALMPVMSGNQSTYDISFFSLNASGQITYFVSENASFNLNFGIPLFALNLKNYNSRIDPLNHELWLVTLGKYAGFSGDLNFIQRFGRFSLEIFYDLRFIKYKKPYSKKVLTNEIGAGLYYEL